jgi:hypothetical protein
MLQRTVRVSLAASHTAVGMESGGCARVLRRK